MPRERERANNKLFRYKFHCRRKGENKSKQTEMTQIFFCLSNFYWLVFNLAPFSFGIEFALFCAKSSRPSVFSGVLVFCSCFHRGKFLFIHLILYQQPKPPQSQNVYFVPRCICWSFCRPELSLNANRIQSCKNQNATYIFLPSDICFNKFTRNSHAQFIHTFGLFVLSSKKFASWSVTAGPV